MLRSAPSTLAVRFPQSLRDPTHEWDYEEAEWIRPEDAGAYRPVAWKVGQRYTPRS